MLGRSKGRDFYDLMFLLAQTRPDYDFLNDRYGIDNLETFKKAVFSLLGSVDLENKRKDFERLLFARDKSKKILSFGEFVNSLS